MTIGGSDDNDDNGCIKWTVVKQLSKKQHRFNPVGLIGIFFISGGIILLIFDLKNTFSWPPQYIIATAGILFAIIGMCMVIIAFFAYRRYRLNFRNKSMERETAKMRGQRRCSSFGYHSHARASIGIAPEKDTVPPVFWDEETGDMTQGNLPESDLQKQQIETSILNSDKEFPIFGELGSDQPHTSKQSYKNRPLHRSFDDNPPALSYQKATPFSQQRYFLPGRYQYYS